MTMLKILPNFLKGLTGSTVMVSTMLLVACSSSPTPNYYTLASAVKPLQSNAIRVIEVLPVGLPDRLDRTQLILQDANGQSQVLDLQRWTSTLSSELRDGLAAGLLQRLGAVDRYFSGSATTLPVYRIAANFSNFDAVGGLSKDSADNISVAVTWTISRVNDSINLAPNATLSKPRLIACRMTFNLPVNTTTNTGINAVVDTSRQALDKVTNAIAASVVTLEGGAKPVDAVCS